MPCSLPVMTDRFLPGNMTVGSLTSFALQSAFVGLGFSGLASCYSDVMKALDAAQRVFEVMDRAPADGPLIPALPTTVSVPAVCAPFDGIHLDAVSFSYPHRPAVVLDAISMDILPNALTVIVGRSGAGKSTLAALLCGLYAPTSGEIRGCVAADCGVMEQSASNILAGSIFDNIAYGRKRSSGNADRTLVEDVEAAAKAANAHEFISSFPMGYSTQVGGGSSNCLLSGGQRARIALARALIRRPRVLILDEPTSSLDAVCEQEVIQPLLALREHTTVIVFTHSKALMTIADHIHTIETLDG